ncbi:MAG: hemolysin III family protein [Bacilli bacterium]|nr:hemolysin III family protein [Bacilli bacterium]
MAELQSEKYYSKGEEIFSAVSHGVGALLSIVGLILMLIKSDTAIEYVSSAIYGGTSLVLYTMSTLYHSFFPGVTKRVFKRFDHLSIYLFIAGTYTPLCLLVLKGLSGLILFIVVWVLAIIGVTLKSIWIKRFALIHILLYLGIGWSIVWFAPRLVVELPKMATVLIATGGVIYSLGVIFYAFKLVKWNHAIWHLFVLGGTILQFLAIYLYVL